MTTIRPASPEDVEAIREVHAAAVREHGSRAYDEEVIEAWAAPDAEPVSAEDVSGTIVAELDGSVVGFGELDADLGEVVAVYVHPEAARSGVGTALLDELETRARRQGLASLELSSSRNAVGFYRSHGYERIQSTAHELEAGVTMAAVRMRKHL